MVANYVRPGGFAYLAENHPIAGVFMDGCLPLTFSIKATKPAT